MSIHVTTAVSPNPPPHRKFECCASELAEHGRTETQLRYELRRAHLLLRQKDEFIERQRVFARESQHRLLNGLQLAASLLSLQSRAAPNGDTVSQLATAANRVSAIGRIHRKLHMLDDAQTVRFKGYLEDLCQDFSTMSVNRPIIVEGVDANIPAVTAIPLAFVANELITNSIKHGKGNITVRFELKGGDKYGLSVRDEGHGLTEGTGPAEGHGLGMTIIRSLVRQIGGELQIDRGRFTILFCCPSTNNPSVH